MLHLEAVFFFFLKHRSEFKKKYIYYFLAMANERERKNMYLDHFTTDFTHIIAAITSIYEIFL